MEIGLIEWFDDSKGFGLIKTADNNEVFLHISNWKDLRNLNAENKLPILFNIGFQRNKNTALDCKYFDKNNPVDWQTLFSIKENNFIVKVKYSEINLLQLTFNSLSSDFDVSIVKDFFIKGIENLSESELLDKHNWIYKIFQNTKFDSLKILLLRSINIRVNKLSNNQILQFWKEKILTDFEPNDTILTQCYKEIEFDELKSIQKIDTRNIIIIKKAQNLAENFNITDFLNFDKIFKIIDNEKLKSKILKDLTKIANSHYLKLINQKINDSTRNETISIWDLKSIISEQPTFLGDEILYSIKIELEKNIIENCSFRILIDSWNENLIELNNDFIKTKVKEDSIENNLLNTVLQYQKIYENVFMEGVKQAYINFEKEIFVTYMNDLPHDKSSDFSTLTKLKQQSIELRADLLNLRFFRNFPVIILATDSYPHNYNFDIENTFWNYWIACWQPENHVNSWWHRYTNFNNDDEKTVFHTSEFNSPISDNLIESLGKEIKFYFEHGYYDSYFFEEG